MTDFLIMSKHHWTKDLSEEERATWTAKEVAKFNIVYEFEDIVECFPDKKLGPYAHAGGKFKIIRVPEILLKDAKSLYEQSQERTFTEVIMLKRRRFKLVLPEIYDKLLDIALSKSDFEKYLVDKDDI